MLPGSTSSHPSRHVSPFLIGLLPSCQACKTSGFICGTILLTQGRKPFLTNSPPPSVWKSLVVPLNHHCCMLDLGYNFAHNSYSVLPADPESQRNTTTTRTPDPVWDLGAHLCRQPRAASLSGRRAVGTGATGLLPPPGALRPICCQRREISDYPSGAAEEE